jgi:hypothetical protein
VRAPSRRARRSCSALRRARRAGWCCAASGCATTPASWLPSASSSSTRPCSLRGPCCSTKSSSSSRSRHSCRRCAARAVQKERGLHRWLQEERSEQRKEWWCAHSPSLPACRHPACCPPLQDYGLTKSYIFAAAMFLAPILGTLAAGQSNRLSIGTQVMVRAELTASIYRKALRLRWAGRAGRRGGGGGGAALARACSDVGGVTRARQLLAFIGWWACGVMVASGSSWVVVWRGASGGGLPCSVG